MTLRANQSDSARSGEEKVPMEGSACFVCDGSTPEGGTTVVMAITTETCLGEKILYSEAVVQICPSCAVPSVIEGASVGCSIPPLLDLEYSSLLQYIRRLADGRRLTGTSRFPSACSLCRTEITADDLYIAIRLSTDRDDIAQRPGWLDKSVE